jgi:sec-independent protein translocase protein TatB
MFDFSFGKLIIIFALCLIVLGPEKLPKLAAQLGRFAGQARAMARHFRSQLEQEIAAEDLKKELRAADEAIAKIAAQTSPLTGSVTDVVKDAANSLGAEVSGMQAAVEAATKPIDIADLDATVTPNSDSSVSTTESGAAAQLESPAAQRAVVDPITNRNA